jgi:hypothetical protein
LVGFERYAERALLLASAGDAVCVGHAVPPSYREFLGGLGLGPGPDGLIEVPASPCERGVEPLGARLLQHPPSLERVARQLGGDDEVWLSCFTASGLDGRLQARLGPALRVRMRALNRAPDGRLGLHDKCRVRAYAAALGLPLPAGTAVALGRAGPAASNRTRALREAILDHARPTGRAIVRGSFSASGSGVFLVPDDDGERRRFLHEIAPRQRSRTFVVEPFHEVLVSPNVGMFIDPRDGKISCVSASDQILDERLCYVGNRSPSRARLIEPMRAAATRFCEWLRDRGATGHLGFDFCEVRAAGSARREFFFAELNPRFNGATYAALLLARLNDVHAGGGEPRWRAFRSGALPTQLRSFPALQAALADLLFDGRRPLGIVPFNVGLLAQGKLMCAAFGRTTGDVDALWSELCRRGGADATAGEPPAVPGRVPHTAAGAPAAAPRP